MMPEWNKIRKVHCIGIGGVGISALARLLLSQGKELSGTEDNESHETLDALRAQGVTISLSLNPNDLPEAECYIYSDAWLTKHEEILNKARSTGAPVLSYFEALGSLSKGYKVIAVAGAHGKTTTTAMLIDVLEAGNLDPTAIVGSLRTKTKSNFRAGKGDYFVIEADEYRRHFLFLTPHILLINNIDTDHLDYYKDLADIQNAFQTLARSVPEDGYIVCNTSDPLVQPVLEGCAAHIVDYKAYFDPNLPLHVLPLHRINAAGVLAIADILHIDLSVAKEALIQFTGTWRRFEYKGITRTGARIYDDYGHHPKEITTTLRSIRTWLPHTRLIVVFQPHLYSRTKLLFDDFVHAFGDADEVLIAPIFAAREAPDPAVSHTALAAQIRAAGVPANAYASLAEIADYLSTHTRKGDTVVTMGAGNVYTIAESLTARS